jgi:hypothetical protein
MAVLNVNFIHRPNIYEVPWGHLRTNDQGRQVMAYPLHGLPETLKENDLPHFYIWRGFEEVAKSILRMPDRFCIPRKDLTITEFSDTPWGELYVPGTRWAWKTDGPTSRGNTSAFAAALPPLDMTPYEYWKHHVSSWIDFAGHRTDVYVVDYSRLISSFQETISDIATWLGEDIKEFVNVKEKIGGQPL